MCDIRFGPNFDNWQQIKCGINDEYLKWNRTFGDKFKAKNSHKMIEVNGN